MPVLSNNTIICGVVDYYCLSCDSYLRNDDEVVSHIVKPVHKKNLDGCTYMDKYKDDFIKKVNRGYFCIPCNSLLSTITKVGLHTAESHHNTNKNNYAVKKNNKVMINNFIINELSWNGLIDKTCVLCNIEFEHENIHKSEVVHLLNLVQSKLELHKNNNVYRKVDEVSSHCLICNIVVKSTELAAHFEGDDHKRNEIEAKSIIEKPENKCSQNLKNNNQEQIIKPETKTAPEPSKILDDAEICEVLNAKNYISDAGNGTKWCILCNWTMDSREAAKHCSERHHNTLLKMHKERLSKQKADYAKASSIKKEIEEQGSNEFEPDAKEKTTKKIPVNKEENKSKILENVAILQKNELNVNFETETVYCKRCYENVEFIFEDIEEHVLEHKTKKKGAPIYASCSGVDVNQNETGAIPKTIKQIPKKVSNDVNTSSNDNLTIEQFAKENHIVIKDGVNQAYCNICKTNVPKKLHCMKEHVVGFTHKYKSRISEKSATEKETQDVEIKNENSEKLESGNATKNVKKPVIVKQTTNDYIDNFSMIRNHTDNPDIVINEEICISLWSFMLMVESECHGWLRCHPCGVSMRAGHIEAHKNTKTHLKAIRDAPVIRSLESEFVREPKPNEYHCGFCNTILKGWDNLEQHLKSVPHRNRKCVARIQLERYMPEIRNEVARDMFIKFALLKMLGQL